jgi:uncharacterized protein YjiS (DUF1127 family)
MTYAYLDHTETQTGSFGKTAINVLVQAAEEVSTVYKTVRQKWDYHKSVAEFSGMNDHMLRGIGIHRSEISAIAEHGADLSKARYYR